KDLAQLVVGHLHWSWRICLAGMRLGEGRRTSGMESELRPHLLHDLVDMAGETGYGTKSFQIGKRLLAIVRSPTPLGIHCPQRYMRKEDDRRAALQPGDFLLEPFELRAAQRAETAGLKIHDIH